MNQRPCLPILPMVFISNKTTMNYFRINYLYISIYLVSLTNKLFYLTLRAQYLVYVYVDELTVSLMNNKISNYIIRDKLISD